MDDRIPVSSNSPKVRHQLPRTRATARRYALPPFTPSIMNEGTARPAGKASQTNTTKSPIPARTPRATATWARAATSSTPTRPTSPR